MRTAFSTFLLVVILGQAVAQDSKKSIAVMDFQGEGFARQEITTLTSRFRAILVQTNAFQVVEREKMDEILKAQDFNLSDACNTNECAVKVGQLLGVEQIIAGNIGKIGSTYTIDLRLIDIEKGRILLSKVEDYRGKVDGLLGVMKTIAGSFAEVARAERTTTRKPSRKWWYVTGGAAILGGGAAALLLGRNSGDKNGLPLPQWPN